MAEIRVQCPSCQAKMKLTATVEKVRCPKCDTLFEAAKCRVKSPSGKRKPTSSKKKPVTSSVFDFDDDDEFEAGDDGSDIFLSSPPRKSRSSRSRPARQKSKPRKQSKPGSIEPDQLRKFAFTIMALGVGAFVLPLIGLQIKGLHAMTPEMQSLGGVFFLFIGGVLLLISYKDHFGSTVQGGMQLVKWGAIGLVVLLVGCPTLMIVKNVAVRGLGGDNDAADHERIIKEMHENMQIPGTPALPVRKTPPPTIPNASPKVTTNNSQPTDPTSPFQDTTPAIQPSSSNSNPSTPNTAGTIPAGRPTGFPSGRRFGPGGMNDLSGAAQSTETVSVILKGFPRGDVVRHLRELRTAAKTPRMRMVKMEDNFANVSFERVDSAQAFADRIKFGRVTNVDAEKREITLEP